MNRPKIHPPLARFEAHPARLLMQERLRHVGIGEILSYHDLDVFIGFDVRAVAPHLLQYARNRLIEEGLVFDTVIGVGLKRVDDSGAVRVVGGQLKRSTNSAVKGARIATTVNYEALAPGERIAFGLQQVKIGLIQQFSRRETNRGLSKLLGSGHDPARLAGAVMGSLKQFE